MRNVALAIIVALASVAFAQQPPDKPEPKAVKVEAPPVISPQHMKDFFKYQANLQQAQQLFQQAQVKFQAVLGEMSKDCGDKYVTQMGPESAPGARDADPICVSKPPEKKSEEKKEK